MAEETSNFRDGILSVVCPVSDESDLSGIGIFSTNIEESGIVGMLTQELHGRRVRRFFRV